MSLVVHFYLLIYRYYYCFLILLHLSFATTLGVYFVADFLVMSDFNAFCFVTWKAYRAGNPENGPERVLFLFIIKIVYTKYK